MISLRNNLGYIPLVSEAISWGTKAIGGGCYIARNVPGISDIVFKNGGCSAEGRKLSALALATYAKSNGPISTLLAPIGFEAAVACVCQGSNTSYVPPPPPPKPWYDNPAVMIGGGVLLLGVLVYAIKKKPAAAPAPAPVKT